MVCWYYVNKFTQAVCLILIITVDGSAAGATHITVLVSCQSQVIHLLTVFSVPSLTLGLSCDHPSGSEVIPKYHGKIVRQSTTKRRTTNAIHNSWVVLCLYACPVIRTHDIMNGFICECTVDKKRDTVRGCRFIHNQI